MTAMFQNDPSTTHVHLLLDDSGSMARFRQQAQDAFNRDLQAIKDAARRTGQRTLLTVWTFGQVVERVLGPVDAQAAPQLSSYNPNQPATRIYDCVHAAVTLAMAEAKPQDAVLIVGVTDGGNTETHISMAAIVGAVKRAQDGDRVTITMMVPVGYGRQLSQVLGIPEGNVREWNVSREGLDDGSILRTRAVDHYFVQRKDGKTATRGFYETNAGELSKTEIRRLMANVSGEIDIAKVGGRTDISSFCRRKFGSYSKGAAFYQLVKKEKVHGHKKLAIVDEDGSVYIGKEDARALLGLPEHADATVVPGDHGKRKVFVQSTSVNRKLDANTEVIWAPRFA